MKSDVRLKYGEIKMNNWYEAMMHFMNMGLNQLKKKRKKDDILHETIMNYILSIVLYFEYKYHNDDEYILVRY